MIHIQREAGFDKIVMSYPSRLSARIGTTLIITSIALIAFIFWLDALNDFFSGTFEFDEIMQLLFTTLVLGFLGLLAKVAFRRRVPESIMVIESVPGQTALRWHPLNPVSKL